MMETVPTTTTTTTRTRCPCGALCPPGSTPRRRYCSTTCRVRAWKAVQAAQWAADHPPVPLEQTLAQLATQVGAELASWGTPRLDP
jgi:hypothetical protein